MNIAIVDYNSGNISSVINSFKIASKKSKNINIEITSNLKVIINSDKIVECGIKKNLKIVDLTGAGDLFASGFLHGFVKNLPLKENLEKGTDMSSKVIQIFGARLKN